ncbi:MAG: CopG family transcriptional regulator [Actinobacteria bacterium]|nr:CopG family transcriptional regulator [Actinomycetota bacterium]
MRTTITFDDDVAAAVEKVRREEGKGLSEAVNDLVRRGLLSRRVPEKPFVQKTYPLGLKIDITCIGDALETLEGPEYR